MKLYRLIAHDKELGAVLSWHVSKKDAERVMKQAQADGQDTGSISAENIPTNKAGLIGWLNRNVRTQNDDA